MYNYDPEKLETNNTELQATKHHGLWSVRIRAVAWFLIVAAYDSFESTASKSWVKYISRADLIPYIATCVVSILGAFLSVPFEKWKRCCCCCCKKTG
jgi:hypothetical protein